jgi:D-alanyl-lipoteichoic acid acyltransferase DltB (MBOAT superfamily)
MSMLGVHISPVTLAIVLPVGISFYTFQSMSYTIDIYRREIHPVRNFLDYALYVSFFPQLVAGPIERAQHLLPQILAPRTITFSGVQRGFYYISIGLLLKIFMADNIARLVDPIFGARNAATGLEYLLAGYGFAFQIYGDFAGYSYIAKGLGAMLGFDIMDNFRLPYFSTNPQEFWRRWHISLSTWLRDYLYIPLGGNRSGRFRTVRNLMITMLLGGLWHGAKFTFILWGLIHGLMLIVFHILPSGLNAEIDKGQISRVLRKAISITLFFHLIVITWYFFRAESVAQLATIGRAFLFDFQPHGQTELALKLLFYIFPILTFQLIQYWSNNLLVIFRLPAVVRAGAYVMIFYLVVIFGVNHAQDFIYFQF